MTTENNENQVTSILDLSDDEIMNLDPATLATPAAPNADDLAAAQAAEDAAAETARQAQEQEAAAQAAAEAEAANKGDDNGDDQSKAQGSADSAEAGQGSDAEKTAVADTAAKAATDNGAADADPAKKAGKDAGAAKAADAPATPAPADELTTLKSFQEKILGKFKANGRDMQVRDADEAIALMQKGVGFHKRMEQLKPNLAIVESLRKADLLDQSKIDFLIDVALKKPEAISKLVQDSGLDPLDLTAEKAGGYKPTSHKVSEQEQAIDEVWSELEGAEGFDRTVKLVTNEWDKASQNMIADKPVLLKVITGHIQSGIYDLVAAEMHREKVLGRLTGLSDLEAYRQVGDAMAAAGKFAHLDTPAGQPTAQGQQAPAVPAVVKPNPKQAEDSDRENKKRAASPARATPGPAKKAITNPLAMSDEEIMKLG